MASLQMTAVSPISGGRASTPIRPLLTNSHNVIIILLLLLIIITITIIVVFDIYHHYSHDQDRKDTFDKRDPFEGGTKYLTIRIRL